ncbi:hypothetical protein GJ496_008923 [Pomphorhynchus laevis]|nr:hypothetical protein GJ496_008923 [Pomphorhynchus laevis]
MGIARDRWHKRRKTGGKRPQPHKKRKYEMGRPAAMTKLGPKRVRPIRTRGGNHKFRALRLDTGGFSWGSESITKKTRIIDVVYHPILVDSSPFKQWYEVHYGQQVSYRKKQSEKKDQTASASTVKKSRSVLKKHAERARLSKLEPHIEEQLSSGRIFACISTKPGQSGRADGYILEGKELEFYSKKIKAKKGK